MLKINIIDDFHKLLQLSLFRRQKTTQSLLLISFEKSVWNIRFIPAPLIKYLSQLYTLGLSNQCFWMSVIGTLITNSETLQILQRNPYKKLVIFVIIITIFLVKNKFDNFFLRLNI